MLSTKDIIVTLQEAKPRLITKYGVQALALFGSYSRRVQTHNSDVDVMDELSKPIGIAFIDLADELEILLNMKVDLVSRKGIKPKYFKAIEPDLIYV